MGDFDTVAAAAAVAIQREFGESGTLERAGLGSAVRLGVISRSIEDAGLQPGVSLDLIDTLTLLIADGPASVGDVWIDAANVRWVLTSQTPTTENNTVSTWRLRRET